MISEIKSLKELKAEKKSVLDNDFVLIGKVIKAVGLEGWMRLALETDFPERFKTGNTIKLKLNNKDIKEFQITDSRAHFLDTRLEVKLSGINNREEASSLVGCFIIINKAERKVLSNDRFYKDELSDMDVISDNEKVGSVIRLEADLPSPYLEVETIEHGSVMIPFRSEFIESIDKINKKVVLKQGLEPCLIG